MLKKINLSRLNIKTLENNTWLWFDDEITFIMGKTSLFTKNDFVRAVENIIEDDWEYRLFIKDICEMQLINSLVDIPRGQDVLVETANLIECDTYFYAEIGYTF